MNYSDGVTRFGAVQTLCWVLLVAFSLAFGYGLLYLVGETVESLSVYVERQ